MLEIVGAYLLGMAVLPASRAIRRGASRLRARRSLPGVAGPFEALEKKRIAAEQAAAQKVIDTAFAHEVFTHLVSLLEVLEDNIKEAELRAEVVPGKSEVVLRTKEDFYNTVYVSFYVDHVRISCDGIHYGKPTQLHFPTKRRDAQKFAQAVFTAAVAKFDDLPSR